MKEQLFIGFATKEALGLRPVEGWGEQAAGFFQVMKGVERLIGQRNQLALERETPTKKFNALGYTVLVPEYDGGAASAIATELVNAGMLENDDGRAEGLPEKMKSSVQAELFYSDLRTPRQIGRAWRGFEGDAGRKDFGRQRWVVGGCYKREARGEWRQCENFLAEELGKCHQAGKLAVVLHHPEAEAPEARVVRWLGKGNFVNVVKLYDDHAWRMLMNRNTTMKRPKDCPCYELCPTRSVLYASLEGAAEAWAQRLERQMPTPMLREVA